MTDAGPVITFEELDTLDADEVANGYDDALEGLPEPASDASRAYWHGWRNGAVAAGYRQHDEATVALAMQVLERRQRRSLH